MGLDLIVPPLALLVMLLVAGVAVGWSWSHWGGSLAPLALFGSALGLVVWAVLLAWLKFGRQLVPARHLLLVPFYMLWKLPLYLSFIVRGRHRSWERAERSVKDSESTQIP